MNKPTAIEATIVVVSGALAAGIANQLTDHHVSTLTTVSAVLAILTAGIALATQISQALRTTTYTCPAKGCSVYVRVKDVTGTELGRLKTYATDHSKHGGLR